MKLSSIACAASLASFANAATYYVTRLHYVTVGPDGKVIGTDVSGIELATADANNYAVVTSSGDLLSTFTPTTLSTVAGSYSSISTDVLDTSVTGSDSSSSAAVADAPVSSSSTSTPVSSFSTASSTSASATASPTGSTGDIASAKDPKWAQEILDLHNEKRAKHSADALTWDSEVYAYAQAYADKFTCGGSLVHSGGQYGENLALGYSNVEDAFNAWYSEGDNYDYSTASSFDHFTAIIWKSTTKLGCAYKACNQGNYVVCSYDPAGNVVGYGLKNLFSS